MTGTVTFTPSEADYLDANRVIYTRSITNRRFLWLGIAGAVLSLGNVSFKLWLGDSLADAAQNSAVMIAFAVMVLGIRFLAPWTTRRAVRNMITQNPKLITPLECHWDGQGISFASRSGTSTLEWRTLHKYTKTDDIFVFQPTDGTMLFIPRHALSSEQAVDLALVAGDRQNRTAQSLAPAGSAP